MTNFFVMEAIYIKRFLLLISENKFFKYTYQIILILSVILAIYITVSDFSGKISENEVKIFFYADMIIWIIFTLDYWIRFFFADNKKRFFKENIFDLLATIPAPIMSSSFKTLSIIKLLRLIRIIAIVETIFEQIKLFAKTNGLIYMIYVSFITIILGSIGIFFAEKGQSVDSFEDAIWWSFVTATTVGYGDISPSTSTGRFIAVVLMLVGIGTISMITGTVSTYFMNKRELELNKMVTNENANKKIELDCEEFSENEIAEIMNFVEFKRKYKNKI